MKTSLFCIALLISIQALTQQWQFAARFGGSVAAFSDAAKAICTDAAGNIYVTGNFNSTINFGNGTTPLTATATGTQTEGFVAKFNSAGLCQWAIDFGGAATDQGGLGIVTDGTTVFVTGQSQFPCMIGTFGPLASVGGSTDGIVFALNASTGATIWARAFGGGITIDMGQAICMDGSGNIYISGVFSTRTTNPTASFGTAGAFPRTVQGNIASATSDLFVAQINATTGNFNWVSAGGASSQAAPLIVGNDNISGSGIAFIPSLNEIVVAGSFASSTANYFSNGSGTSSVTLTNNGQADICLLRLNLSGNFISGVAAGGANPDEALGLTYDAASNDVYIAGYFNSPGISGAISLTNSVVAGGFDEIYYARYNLTSNSFTWAKSAAGSAGGNDFAFAIASGATGIYVTGRFQGNISFPTSATPLTASSTGFDDVYLVKLNPSNGNATQLGIGNSVTGTDAGMGVAVSTDNNIWIAGFFAGSTLSFTPSSPPVSVTIGVDQELFIARYNDPPPTISTHPSASTACRGLAASFTVAATGSLLNYQWQESADAGFTSPVTLTNTGIYSNTTTATLTISDNSTVDGRYYRAIVTNSGGTATSNGALLTATAPVLPAANISTTHAVNTSNNLYYGAACALIAKVVPSGAAPVTGNITTEVWVEGTVPTYLSQPFVQRHYQITPSANPTTATATITLYFSQAEFDAFNAAPGSVANLPANSLDDAGKGNLRIQKYAGSSNNSSGLPGSYTSTSTLINPDDAFIVWNAVTNLWEISFDVTGFSGFVVHTNQFSLPVNLVSFSAQLSGTHVQLNWKTSDELNNDHFELERSIDGRTFAPIANLPSLNGSGIKNYDWMDANAASMNTSRIFYRLKIVSNSGSVEYSNIIAVSLGKSTGIITSIGPNPFKDKLNINLNMPASGKLIMKLTDMNGKVLLQENVQAPRGFSTYVMKRVERLSAGMYYLSVEFDEQLQSFKLIKQD